MQKKVFTLGIAALGLTIVSIGSIQAAQAEADMPKKVEKTEMTADGVSRRFFALPKSIQLTTEQNTALEEIKQKLAPKVTQLSEQQSKILTDEQKTARTAAITKAKMDGLKGKARTSAIDQAINLTDDQKKQLAETKSELAKLRLEIKQQIHGLLTEKQQADYKLPKTMKSAATRETKASMPDK